MRMLCLWVVLLVTVMTAFGCATADNSAANLAWKMPTYLAVGAPRDAADLPLVTITNLCLVCARLQEPPRFTPRTILSDVYGGDFGQEQEVDDFVGLRVGIQLLRPLTYLYLPAIPLYATDYFALRSFVPFPGGTTPDFAKANPRQPLWFPNFNYWFKESNFGDRNRDSLRP